MKYTPFGMKDNNCTCTYNFTCRVCLNASIGTSPREDRQDLFHVVVNIGDLNDSHAAKTLDEALEVANFDGGTEYYINRVEACDIGAARLRCLWESKDSECLGIEVAE